LEALRVRINSRSEFALLSVGLTKKQSSLPKSSNQEVPVFAVSFQAAEQQLTGFPIRQGEPELFHLVAFERQAREPDPNTRLPSLICAPAASG